MAGVTSITPNSNRNAVPYSSSESNSTKQSNINYFIYECTLPVIRNIGKILADTSIFLIKFAIAGKVFYLHPHAFFYTAVGCFAFTPLRNLVKDGLRSMEFFLDEFIFSLSLKPYRLMVLAITIFLSVQTVFDYMTIATYYTAAKIGVSLYENIYSKLPDDSAEKQLITDYEFKKKMLDAIALLQNTLEKIVNQQNLT